MSRFLAELRRRKVWLVGGVYVVAAWVILQVAATIENTANLPPWTDMFILVLLGLGLPIALILAWAQETQARGGYEVAEADDAPDLDPKAIAVLPFHNLSPDPDDAYFAAGIHEEILNHLVKIGGLTVMARTSVLQYEGVKRPISEIAAELGVASVMEGSVRYADEAVRITVQLNDARTGAHLWSETYDRPFENIFKIQSEVAAAVAVAMQAELTPEMRESIASGSTTSLEAYDLYLRALSHLPFLQQTVRLEMLTILGRAIELDPEFADAYALRAVVYANMLDGPLSEAEVTKLGESDIRAALAINPDHARANSQMSWIHKANGDWHEAGQTIRHAMELDPGDGSIMANYARHLYQEGGAAEAIPLAERAARLEPLFGWVLYVLGHIYLAEDRQEQATTIARRLVDAGISPEFGHFLLAWQAALKGNAELAAEHFFELESEARERPALDFEGGFMGLDAYLAAITGDHVHARELIVRQEEQGRSTKLYSAAPISGYVGLGDLDGAFRWLKVMMEENAVRQMVTTLDEPVFAPLRADPRFTDVRRHLGLDP